MKLNYSTCGLFAVLLTTTAMAQRVDQAPHFTPRVRTLQASDVQPANRPSNSGARGGGEVVWSEDFANGLAGNNPTGGAWTVSGDNGNIWKRATSHPNGAFVGPTPAAARIQSTTVLNGYMLFNGDSVNCTWDGNTPTAIDQDLFIAYDGSLESPTLDLSATPFVELAFQQRFRYCCGDRPHFVEISTDGGATWPTRIAAVVGNTLANALSPTETFFVNIAEAISADPSNVRIRFHHDASLQTSHYHWQIDDVQISNLPENEMIMNYAYTSTTGLGEEYGRIPSSQLPPTMNIGAEVFNYGGQEQTNVVVNCSVTDEDDVEVFASSIPVGTLTSSQVFVADVDVDLPALPLGLYTATFTITSDQIDLDGDPADNTRVRTFEVTDNIYSLDNLGNHPTGLQTATQIGSGSFTDNPENVKLMTMYYINSDLTANGLELDLGSTSAAGSSVIVSILDTLDVLGTPSVVNEILAESDPYVLTQQDIAAGVVTIPFIEPVVLDPNAYYAVASLFAAGDNNVTIVDDTTVPQPGLASALWIPFDPPNNQNFYGGNGTAWAVRLVSAPSVSVAENTDLEGVSMYPNPTSGILRINATQSEKYTAEVFNMLGELLLTNLFTTSTTMDLAPLADGVYSVRISNGTSAMVQRVTLN